VSPVLFVWTLLRPRSFRRSLGPPLVPAESLRDIDYAEVERRLLAQATLDDVALPVECDCKFAPTDPGEDESYHYRRRCQACGKAWHSLHCPHDGVQSCCPQCGARAESLHRLSPPPTS
jgi:hypothetical protein